MGRGSLEMAARSPGHDASAWCSIQEPDLDEVGFVHLLDRFPLLPDGGRKRRQAHGPAAELVQNGQEKSPVDLVESKGIDLEQVERARGLGGADRVGAVDLREVANP